MKQNYIVKRTGLVKNTGRNGVSLRNSFVEGVRGITGDGLPSKVIQENAERSNEVRLYKGRHYVHGDGVRTLPKYAKYIPNLTKIYDIKWRPIIPKVVVFDLDETIGNFSDLYLIWAAIFNTGIYTGQPNPNIAQSIFNELLDLYPEFLRYGILHILDFIRTKIQNGESHCIYLYTNNQCIFTACPDSRQYTPPSPTEWVEMIIVYLNMKLRTVDTIFAKPICAFKIGSRVIEPLRESRSKTHRDFLKCAVLPKNTEICFVDDTYHSKMAHNKVYYIQPPPYFHELSQTTIIDRFMESALYTKINGNQTDSRIITYEGKPFPVIPRTPTLRYGVITNSFELCSTEFPRSPINRELNSKNENNKEIYNKMMYYIKEFFCISAKTPPTRRRNIRIGKFTRRKINTHRG